MANVSTILQKRLEELELSLSKVFNDSMETTLPYHQLLSEAINGRIRFLKNLLSAEIDSHPHKPQHLHHIAQRLSSLETAFRNWNEFQTLPSIDFLNTLSTCSCTHSCLYDGEEEDDTTMPDFSPLANEEEYPETELDKTTFAVPVDAKNEDKREKDRRFGVVKNGKMMVAATILTLVVGVVTASFTRDVYFQGKNIFLTPT